MMEGTQRRGGACSLPETLRNGVRFSCTDCGRCCSGAPGRVRVSEEEIRKISEYRNLPESEFRKSEIRRVGGDTLLREKENGDCVFFVNQRCSIHAVKPRQCRTYPFWFRNVRSEAAWERTRKECPGIGEGKWVSAEEMVETVREELSDE